MTTESEQEESIPLPSEVRMISSYVSNRIAYWNQQLIEIQSKCEHINREDVARCNTGNYDPSADSHWINHSCQDCLKTWRTNK